MRKHILLVLIIASLVLVACDGAIPETHIPPEAAASLEADASEAAVPEADGSEAEAWKQTLRSRRARGHGCRDLGQPMEMDLL